MGAWFQILGQGTEMLILHTKADLASRFSQHPSVPTWHTLPPNPELSSQGLGCPCHPEAPPYIIQSFGSLYSLLLSLFSLCVPIPFRPSSPWWLPWPQSLGPVNLPESSFPINLPLIYSNLAWIGSFHQQRNNLSNNFFSETICYYFLKRYFAWSVGWSKSLN